MTRGLWMLLLLTGVACAQEQPADKQLKTRGQKSGQAAEPKAGGAQDQEPPEEDETLKPPREYSFNPVQAEHELKIGAFYFRKGNYRAAVMRFGEAGKWNPSLAEAYLRMGEAEEKLKDRQAARDAYRKYLDLSPDAKDAESIKKKVASLH